MISSTTFRNSAGIASKSSMPGRGSNPTHKAEPVSLMRAASLSVKDWLMQPIKPRPSQARKSQAEGTPKAEKDRYDFSTTPANAIL